MNKTDNVVSIHLVKKGNNLVYLNKGNKAIHKEYINSLADGQIVEVFFEGQVDNGTNLQLAKIHACIRKIASEIGDTFDSVKKEIKSQSGLAYDTHEGSYAKSFAECSKEELGLVIQSIIEVGDTVGINFRGKIPQSS